MLFETIFSKFVSCPLVCLTVSFTVQKLFLLMKSPKFIFAFDSLSSRHISAKKLLQLNWKKLLPVFFSRSFMVLGLTFTFLINFDFNFVYCVWKWYSSIFLMSLATFPNTLCWRNCLLHRIFFPFLSKLFDLGADSFLGFLFCSIGLCVYFYDSSILFWLFQILFIYLFIYSNTVECWHQE